LAVVTAADMLARAIASSGVARATAASAARDEVVNFHTPLLATEVQDGPDTDVVALAFGSAGGGRFLVKRGDDTIAWLRIAQIVIRGAS